MSTLGESRRLAMSTFDYNAYRTHADFVVTSLCEFSKTI